MLTLFYLIFVIFNVEAFCNNICSRKRVTVKAVRPSNSSGAKSEDSDELDKRLRLFFDCKESYSLASSFLESYMLQQKLRKEIPYNQPLLTVIDEAMNHKSRYDYLFKSLYENDTNQFPEPSDNHVAGNKRCQSFKLHIAYKGNAFCGWQIQPNNELPSVQQTLIDILDPFLNTEMNAKPIDIRVCGRTDAGVSALDQICRVRTKRRDVSPSLIQEAINDYISSLNTVPTLWCKKVERVSEKFHPTFDASCRAYVYILDAETLELVASELSGCLTSINLIRTVVDNMIHHLLDKELDYFSMSIGPVKTETTSCTIYHAKARIVGDECGRLGLCIELVGNRFLRRMVRILVATVIREAISSIHQEIQTRESTVTTQVLSLIKMGDRSMTAKAAPPNGLFFTGADFSTL